MPGIKQQIASGVFYTAIAKYTGIIISIAITGVLSRLLTPADFGTIVPITILVAFFVILGDIGIGPAIIQNNELTKENTDSIFSFTIITGAVLSAIFFMSSWTIAAIYDSQIFVSLCQLLCVSLFFSCANVVPNALLYKGKKFKFLAIRSLVVQLSAGTVAIVAACLGAGLYALIVQSIISSVLMFAVSYRENPLKLHFLDIDWQPLKKIRSFSSYQFLFNVINYFTVNLDKLIINKYLGAAQLGYYDKSYKLMQMPLQNIPFIITPVMHPIFSQMQNDMATMRIYYCKVVRLLAFIGFPLSILLFFGAHDIITIIFGTQWEASVPVFKLLALSVGFQIILATSGSIFQSSGATHLLFLCGVLSTLTIVIAILTGLFVFATIEAIGALLTCAFVINFFMCYLIMFCGLFKAGFTPFIKQIISPLILSAALTLVLYVVSPLAQTTNVVVSFIIKGTVATCISVAYIQLTKEYDIRSKVKEILARFKKPTAPESRA